MLDSFYTLQQMHEERDVHLCYSTCITTLREDIQTELVSQSHIAMLYCTLPADMDPAAVDLCL